MGKTSKDFQKERTLSEASEALIKKEKENASKEVKEINSLFNNSPLVEVQENIFFSYFLPLLKVYILEGRDPVNEADSNRSLLSEWLAVRTRSISRGKEGYVPASNSTPTAVVRGEGIYKETLFIVPGLIPGMKMTKESNKKVDFNKINNKFNSMSESSSRNASVYLHDTFNKMVRNEYIKVDKEGFIKKWKEAFAIADEFVKRSQKPAQQKETLKKKESEPIDVSLFDF